MATEHDDQMVDAVRRQLHRKRASMLVDRRGWSPAQWCDDAKRLMREPDGAITSLVNGHASHLIAERDRLRSILADLLGAVEREQGFHNAQDILKAARAAIGESHG